MPQIADGDLYEVTFVFRHQNQSAYLVRHYDVNEVIAGLTDCNLIAPELSDVMGESFRANMSIQSNYRGCRVRRIQPNPTDVYTSVADAGAGDIDADPLPTQVAGLISWRTGFAGRSKRGRSYIPFPTEDGNSSGAFPTVGQKALLNNIAVNLSTSVDIVGGGGTYRLFPIVYSRKLDARFEITSFIIRDQWATQRKRSSINPGDPLPVP